jgi:hypothetical protein
MSQRTGATKKTANVARIASRTPSPSARICISRPS